ncbi:MAG: hypothetical protein F4Z30_12440 [Gemmatimonadetes bacterium]|nr:hypothetical protein [Gemmatimonadota bacterium]
MSEPITQAQDHDRRIGRLEGISEQLTVLDSLERSQTAGFAEVNRRLDAQFRWLVGIQITVLLALAVLILGRLS